MQVCSTANLSTSLWPARIVLIYRSGAILISINSALQALDLAFLLDFPATLTSFQAHVLSQEA